MIILYFLLIIAGLLMFFIISYKFNKSEPSKILRYGPLIGCFVIILGVFGLMLSQFEFFLKPSFAVQFDSNISDIISSIADLMWPLVVFAGVFWFFPQILDFLKDPVKVGAFLAGLSGKYNPQQNVNFAKFENLEFKSYENLPDFLIDLIEKLKKQLSDIDPSERNSSLLKHAAICEINSEFSHIYYLIFGTQIQALQLLNNNEKSNLFSFYENFKQLTKNEKDIKIDSFDIWVNILTINNLISKDNNVYSITEKGKEFLKFIKIRDYYILKSF